jgi:hypothetical protein
VFTKLDESIVEDELRRLEEGRLEEGGRGEAAGEAAGEASG